MRKEEAMAVCEVCGNDYWMAFEVTTVGGNTHVFDSFECAIQRLAPICEHCHCRVIGHGVEVEGRFYCCAHCARTAEGDHAYKIRDTVGAHPG
jgi:phage terminase large subunit GpA-like protein